MRKVYDTNGNDVSSTVLSFLRANRTLYMCDLMMMSTWIWWFPVVNGLSNNTSPLPPQTMNFYFSFGDFPVQVGNVQTGPNQVSPITLWNTSRPAVFLPQPLVRDKFSYGIGFTAENADITWYCGDSLVPVCVPGTCPPSTSFTTFFDTPPVSVNVQPGRRVSLRWMGGLANAGIGDGYADGFGAVGVGASFPSIKNVSAAQGAAGMPWQGALLAAFCDAAGNVVDGYYLIGNGADLSVPSGASQMTLGMNDVFLNDSDNGGCWMVGVSGVGNVAQSTLPTWQQAFAAGMFDECNVNLYRAFYDGDPKQGGTLLGTTLMFRGFVRDTEVAQDHVKLSLSSLLDMFQEVQVPTQIIQPGNRTTPYVPSGITFSVASLNVAQSSPTVLAFNNPGIADHAFQDGYIITGGVNTWTPQNGQPQPVFLRIRDNVTISSILYLYLYEPSVIPLASWNGLGGRGNPINISSGILLQKPLSNSYGAPGFPAVPPPEIGI